MSREYPIDSTDYDHNGVTITVKWWLDHDFGPPWKNDDGHGPVSDWVRNRKKRPGERVLSSDHGSKLYYDFKEAVKIAKRDGWGDGRDAKPYKTGTKGQQAVRAVEHDFDYLRRWCSGQWQYVGYSVEIEGFPDYADSVWGYESDYALEREKEVVADAIKWIDNELSESADAECRDIVTV